MLRGVEVLVRRHPVAALDMAGAGLAAAGRAGPHELREAAPELPLLSGRKTRWKRAGLERRERRRLMRALKAEKGAAG